MVAMLLCPNIIYPEMWNECKFYFSNYHHINMERSTLYNVVRNTCSHLNVNTCPGTERGKSRLNQSKYLTWD